MKEVIHSYKELIVWQRSIELVVSIYELTDKFPKEEIFGLTSQIRRSAVSIPSNIAEGRSRGTRADYLHFLRISYGSGAELETQLEISKKLLKTKVLNYNKVSALLDEIMRMLNVMISKLQVKKLVS
jgi:four helix bundle protein